MADSNSSKKSRDVDDEDGFDYDGVDAGDDDHDIFTGSEGMFAAFAQNTVLIHEEFRKFAAMETKNTSSTI
jgi:hypothetical protein